VGVVPYRLIQIDDYNDVDIDGERVKLFSNRIVNCYKFVAMSIDFYDNTHTHTHLFISLLSGTTRVSRYQKGKTNLDFTEARDSEWLWNLLGHMHVCT